MSPHSENNREDTGLSQHDEPVFLVVGQLGKPHGIRGEISFRIHTDFPERLAPGKVLYLGDEKRTYTIVRVRGGGDRLIMLFEGYSDRDQVAELRNLLAFVRSDEVPGLEEGDFYYHELIGLKVVTDDGRDLGILEEIIDTNANDVFVVRSGDGSEILLPDIDDVVLEIDLDQERMLVHLIDGL